MRSSSDYPVWELKPRGLTIDEISNPYQVLDDFFDCASLSQRREMLWRWFICTITDAFAVEMDQQERSGIASNYTDLQKLIEAVSIIQQAHQAKTTPCEQP